MNLLLAHAPADWTLTRASGPGLRFCIFVRGCSIVCTRKCLNAPLIPAVGGHSCPPAELVRALSWAHEDYPPLDGITVLGGEPTDQAEALLPLLQAAHARGLSTMLYTGHVYEDLHARGTDAQRALLGEVDILVDGPFVEERASPQLVWRGSDNQRFHLFHYPEARFLAAQEAQGRAVAILERPGLSLGSGPQSPEGVRALRSLLRRTS